MTELTDDQIRAMLETQQTQGDPSLSDEEISKKLGMNKQYPTGVAREAAIASGSVLRGTTSLAGLPGDLEHYVSKKTDLPRLLGYSGEDAPQILPTSGGINKALGLEERPDLQPSGGESWLAAGAGGLGAALPIVATGGAALPALAGGVAGGLGAEAGHEIMPESPWAPLVGGLAGGGLAGFGAQRWLGRGGLERLAESMGSSKTFQEAGQAMKGEAQAWMTRLPSRLDALWSPLDKVAQSASVPLPNFLPEFLKLGPAGQAISRRLPSSLFGQMLSSISKKGGPSPSFAPTWSGARELWRVLDDIQRNPTLVRGIGQARLSKLYGSLSADMVHAVGTVDPRLVDVAQNAILESERLNGFASTHVSRILNPKNAPERVAASYASGAKLGGSDLADLRQELPQTVDELAAALVRKKPVAWAETSPEAKVALVPKSPTRDALSKAVKEGLMSPESGAFMHVLDRLRHGSPLGAAFGFLTEHTLGGSLEEALFGGALGAAATALAPMLAKSGRALVRSGGARAGAVAGVSEGGNLQPSP